MMRIFLFSFLFPLAAFSEGSPCPAPALVGKWKLKNGSVTFRHADGKADSEALTAMDLTIEGLGDETYRISTCSAPEGSGMGHYNCRSGDFQVRGSDVIALGSLSGKLGRIGRCRGGRLEFGYDSRKDFWKGAIIGGLSSWELSLDPNGLEFQMSSTIEGESIILKSLLSRQE